MATVATCTCGNQMRGSDDDAGRRVTCRSCGHEMVFRRPKATLANTNERVAGHEQKRHGVAPVALSVTCPCGNVLRAKDESAGKQVHCLNCGRTLTFPSRSKRPAAAAREPVGPYIGSRHQWEQPDTPSRSTSQVYWPKLIGGIVLLLLYFPFQFACVKFTFYDVPGASGEFVVRLAVFWTLVIALVGFVVWQSEGSGRFFLVLFSGVVPGIMYIKALNLILEGVQNDRKTRSVISADEFFKCILLVAGLRAAVSILFVLGAASRSQPASIPGTASSLPGQPGERAPAETPAPNPVEKLATAVEAKQPPSGVDVTVRGWIVPYPVTKIVCTKPERVLAEHGVALSPEQESLIQAVDGRMVESPTYQVFAIAGTRTTIAWCGAATARPGMRIQVFVSVWNGHQWQHVREKMDYSGELVMFSASAAPGDSEVYVMINCATGTISTDYLGVEGRARGESKNRSGALNRPPTIEIVAVEPESPKPGDILIVRLRGTDPDGDPVRLEFRRYADRNWEQCERTVVTGDSGASHGRVVLRELRPGELRLEVRAVDDEGAVSEVLTKRWSLTSWRDQLCS